MAELTEMTFREDLDSERQVLLGVPGNGFSQFDRLDKAGLTEIVLLPWKKAILMAVMKDPDY